MQAMQPSNRNKVGRKLFPRGNKSAFVEKKTASVIAFLSLAVQRPEGGDLNFHLHPSFPFQRPVACHRSRSLFGHCRGRTRCRGRCALTCSTSSNTCSSSSRGLPPGEEAARAAAAARTRRGSWPWPAPSPGGKSTSEFCCVQSSIFLIGKRCGRVTGFPPSFRYQFGQRPPEGASPVPPGRRRRHLRLGRDPLLHPHVPAPMV